MTQTTPATCVLGPGKTGLTIGLRVLNLDGSTYAAFSAVGVAETSTAGTYRKAGGVVCPLAGGYIVWGTALVDYAEATVESAAVNVTYWAGGAVPTIPSASDNAAAVLAAIADVPTVAEFEARTLPAADYTVVSDLPAAAPTAAAVADAVWDEALAGHAVAGSTGAALSAAGGAGDPWSTALPGSYNSGTAGSIIGALAAIDTTAVTISPANNAGHLTITAARTFEATISGLTIPATWTAALWTLKTDDSRPDAAALTDGLQRLNGAALPSGILATAGSLTVNQAGGSVVVWLSDGLTARLGKATGIGWDVKFIDAAGDSDGADGTADVALTETKATA